MVKTAVRFASSSFFIYRETNLKQGLWTS